MTVIYPKKFIQLKERYKFFTTDCLQRRQRLTCAQCKDILIEPYQSNCGCRYCFTCLPTCENICPQCGIGGSSKNDNVKFTFDKAAEKEIFGLIINCINKQCEHKCKLCDLIGHLETCEYNECTNKCADCGVELSGEELIEKHKDISGDTALLCDNWKSICPYKCSEEVQDNIKMHLNICASMPIECAMKGVGCTKLLSREEMADHIRNDTHYHMTLMMQEMINLRIENERIKSEHLISVDKRNNEIKKLKGTEVILDFQLTDLTANFIAYEKDLYDISNIKRFADSGNFKVKFTNVWKPIQKARGGTVTILRSFKNDTLVPNYTLFFCLTLAYDSNLLCVSMEIQRSTVDNDVQDSDLQIGIKWKNDDTVDDSIRILSNNANMQSGKNSKIVNLTKPLNGFKIRDKDELSFYVEITSVAVPETED